MTTLSQVMTELKKNGNEQTRKTYARHGAPENMFGVKVGDLKTIAKKIHGKQKLAYELYDTGNPDAMYLAGIVADGSQMTKKKLDEWAKAANWYMISEYTVPGVAHESEHARSLANKWIQSTREHIASAGWNTWSGVAAVTPDDELDLDEIEQLLEKVKTEIDGAGNRVRYTMNGFVIAVGTYVKPLLKKAKSVAKAIGAVSVDMGGTACKVPLATEYITKVESANRVGKKRKTVKC